MDTIGKKMREYKERVDSELKRFFDRKIKGAKQIDPASANMARLLKDYTLRGGKRLRAALVYHGYRCFKKNMDHDLLRASLCIELVQSYLLIHDDIIDQDSMRRGGPAMHTSYSEYFRKKSMGCDFSHLGVSMAIIAGDLCSAFANEILAETGFRQKNKVEALKSLNTTIRKVVYGEALDILSGIRPVTPKELAQIHRLKTSSYTIEGPLHIGALLAGAKKKDLSVLSRYGILMGQAFQLEDDILGMFGDEKKIGKPVGSDLREGKKTLIIIKALEKADEKQKKMILKALGNRNITKKQVDDVRKIVEETGSLEHSQTLVKNCIVKAKSVIHNANLREEGKSFLMGLTDFISARDM